eukprot:XP_014632435.1 uncharacterized protein LOC106799005 [Glycine max]
MEKNLFRGFSVGTNNVEISILQYADYTIFFGEASMENVKTIKAVLRTFELVSDLKINFSKSCFGAIGMPDQWKHDAAKYINCSLLFIPFIYLDIPIGANPRRCQLWDLIINKVPNRVVDKLVSIQRRFLWGGGIEQKKIAWIRWDSVCLPKEKEGLGLKDIKTFNPALLGKWKLSLCQHQVELWARVLDLKYGGWRSMDEVTRGTNESIWWQDLKMVLINRNRQ